MARARVNTFTEESYTNSIGQTLNPGDKVVAVTTGYGHSVSVFEGVFEGVYRSDKHQLAGTRVGQIPVERDVIVYDENGEHEEKKFAGYDKTTRNYKYVPTGKRYNLVPKTVYRKSSLQRNRVFKIDTELTKVTI